MKRLLIALAALCMTGCFETDEQIARDPKYGPEARACAAANVAIRKAVAPAEAIVGLCDLDTSDRRHFVLGMPVKIRTPGNPDTIVSYWVKAEVDPATGAMLARILDHY